MDLLDLTLPEPASNLALDEALLNEAEDQSSSSEVLRLWESPVPLVVAGRASKLAREVNLDACRQADVPVLRRCSGGTAVVAGPGCLMYAVILSYEQHPQLRSVDRAHQYVMLRMRDALGSLNPGVQYRGSCDLTLGDRKISGNSLRCKKRHMLYHGTVLYEFPLRAITQWLGMPPRQPDYRQGRKHAAFVTNFPHPGGEIRRAIAQAWNAQRQIEGWPEAATNELVRLQYSQDTWNRKL